MRGIDQDSLVKDQAPRDVIKPLVNRKAHLRSGHAGVGAGSLARHYPYCADRDAILVAADRSALESWQPRLASIDWRLHGHKLLAKDSSRKHCPSQCARIDGEW